MYAGGRCRYLGKAAAGGAKVITKNYNIAVRVYRYNGLAANASLECFIRCLPRTISFSTCVGMLKLIG